MKPTCDTDGTATAKSATAPAQPELRRAFDLCVQKMRANIQRLADGPKSGAWAGDGNYFARNEGFYHIGNWTSAFFTGMALLAWQQTDTTLKCFVRPDDSVCHAYRFDLKTGAPLGPDNICGYGVDSHWARGTGWAIYGFALAYKYTHGQRYLDAASRLALKFLSLLDREVVPVWDFKLPPGEPAFRDSSALVVVVCGLQELAKQGGQDSKFFHSTRPLLLRLCSDDYLNTDERCRGLLRSAYGNRAAYSSWGDYFLMEALARELFQSEGWW